MSLWNRCKKIFSDQTNIEVVKELFDKSTKVLQKAAFEDWELVQLETYLKEQTDFSDAQQDIFLKLWRSQKFKIHEMISKQVVWNNCLHKMAWRIDSKAKSRNVPEMNELTTIVEMVVGDQTTKDKGAEVIRFEMDKDQLQSVLQQVNQIQKLLAKVST